jgi:hypothetical protein
MHRIHELPDRLDNTIVGCKQIQRCGVASLQLRINALVWQHAINSVLRDIVAHAINGLGDAICLS